MIRIGNSLILVSNVKVICVDFDADNWRYYLRIDDLRFDFIDFEKNKSSKSYEEIIDEIRKAYETNRFLDLSIYGLR